MKPAVQNMLTAFSVRSLVAALVTTTVATAVATTVASAQAAPTETTGTFNEAVVDAPPTEVWRAFTTKAGMESWMVGKAEVDFRVGGLLRTNYRKDSVIGDEGTIENAVLSFDPQRMYSIKIVKTPKGFPFATAYKSVWTVVYFEPVGVDKTKVSIRMLGYTHDDESQKMREFFVRGNQYTLDQLVAKYRTPK